MTDRIELDLDWDAEEVPPGTPSDEDPTETVRPGWWVRGFTPAGNPEVEIHIASGPVYDENDDDITEQFAGLLADIIADSTSPTSDIVARMTPAVAEHVRDALRKLLRNYERPGSPSEDIIATIDEINDQLRAAEHQEAGGR